MKKRNKKSRCRARDKEQIRLSHSSTHSTCCHHSLSNNRPFCQPRLTLLVLPFTIHRSKANQYTFIRKQKQENKDKQTSHSQMSDDDDFNFSGYNVRISASREPDVEAIDPAGDVVHLTQAWIDERAAPDLLQYQEQCIQRLLAKIEEQVSSGIFFSGCN